MTRFTSLRLSLVTALVLGAAVASGQAAERPVTDWQLRGAGTQVKAGTGYTLFNVTDKEAVRYGERKWGINLVWDKGQNLNNIKIVGVGNANGPIKFGDKVAIHVEKGGYLKYQKRDFGVNLVWSTPPVFEFMITGGKKGTPVPTNTTIGLYNCVEKDFMVYADRPVGINIRWYKDRDKGSGLAGAIKDAVKDLVKDGLHEIADEFKGK